MLIDKDMNKIIHTQIFCGKFKKVSDKKCDGHLLTPLQGEAALNGACVDSTGEHVHVLHFAFETLSERVGKIHRCLKKCYVVRSCSCFKSYSRFFLHVAEDAEYERGEQGG